MVRATAGPVILNVLDQGPVEVEATGLLIFIDETGHEQLKDPAYPVFGLGGCAVMAGSYHVEIAQPWNYMKDIYFEGSHEVIHAADLQGSNFQKKALGEFFSRGSFGRVAAVLTDKASLAHGLSRYEVVAGALVNRMLDVLRWVPSTSVTLLFEASERGDSLAFSYFYALGLQENEGGQARPITVRKFKMLKSANEPGLQVADFIMHAAGGCARAKRQGAQDIARKDFDSVFRRSDPRLSSFIHINDAVATPVHGQ